MSETEAVSLEPCPFCATGPSGDHLATQVQAYSCGNEFSIFCEGCGVETARYETRDAAIAAWNTRALSTHKDEVARLREALACDLAIVTDRGRSLPWEMQSGCSYRRIGNYRHDGNVLAATTQPSDGHLDLTMPEDQLAALVRIINAMPSVIAALTHEKG